MWRAPATEPEPEHKTPDTTNTQDNFATVPEITKEFECLIDAVLNQRKPEVTINAMVDEGKKSEGGHEDKMPVDEPRQKGELKLNHLKPITGKREELKKFLQDVKLYLFVNEKKIYNHPAKKISFALSFMNEGDAASWKEQLLEVVMAKDPFDLGTWEVYEKNLKDAFQPYDAPGDALNEMKTLRIENGLIEEHNAQFKMIVTKSRLDKTSPQ